MRQLYAHVANESTRRLVEDGMSTGLTNTHTARRFSVLFTCSLENNAFSVLHYVIKVTSHYLMLHRFEIHSALELSRTALLGCRLLVGNQNFDISIIPIQYTNVIINDYIPELASLFVLLLFFTLRVIALFQGNMALWSPPSSKKTCTTIIRSHFRGTKK